MCSIVCDGRCRPTKSSSTGVGAVCRFAVGTVWVTGRYVVWPASVVAYRWVSGAPMLPNARPLSRPAWLVRVRWSQWPRWQRATVRLAITLLAVAGYLAPLLTALAATAVVGAGVGVGIKQRRRVAAIRSGAPRRVTVKVGRPIADQPAESSSQWNARQTAGVR
jgi:hypothetical protein